MSAVEPLSIEQSCVPLQPESARLPALVRRRAGIIGLGQMGSQFDESMDEREIWTHAAAYQAMPQFNLVAGADPDTNRLRCFLDRRGVPMGYRHYREMLANERLDVVSVCTPTPLHHEIVLEAVRAGARAIFCEKPLASTMGDALEIVRRCADAGVVLAVNHSRRWDPIYGRVRQLIHQGVIGELEAVAGLYPGKVFTMGTHLFDLMRLFAGNVEWVCGDSAGYVDGEWSFSGLVRFASGVRGTILCGKQSRNHLFELDLIGNEGRIRVVDDGGRIEFHEFHPSRRYAGHRELSRIPLPPLPSRNPESSPETYPEARRESRMVAALQDLHRCITDGGRPAGSGEDGLAALAVAFALCESTALGSVRVDVRH